MSTKRNNNSLIKPLILKNENKAFLESSNQIKTNIVDTSLKIVNSSDEIIMHFLTNEFSAIEIIDNIIYLYTSDEIPFMLIFRNNLEAELGNERINNIINGLYLG